MSDRDKPVNPFGRSERTIIRPNPGGRLPNAPPAHPPADPSAAQTARSPFSPIPLADTSSPQQPPGSQYQPVPPAMGPVAAPNPSYAAAPRTQASEDWISSQNQPVQRPQLPPAPVLRVDDLVAPNANPIMRAAGPLLQLLARLRV